MIDTNDPRVKRWGSFAKGAAILVFGFFVAPFIFTAITGLIGLLAGLAIVGVAWTVLPAIEDKAKNMRLKLIKAEAAKNPIETLQNDYKQKSIELDNRKKAIEQLKARIRTFADGVNELGQKFGTDKPDYIKLLNDLKDLNRIQENRVATWKKAHKQLELYATEIDKAVMIWDISKAAAAARESSGLTEDEFYAKIKSETAFDSVQNGYNEAIASLDTMLVEDKPLEITEGNKNVIELTGNTVKVTAN
jgi:hypothetical protein